MYPMNARWKNISIGDSESFDVLIDEEKVSQFIRLSGDDNPLHTDISFAEKKGYKKPIVHGMLLASFFSKLVGKYFLCDDNLYLSQSLNFKKPVLIGETVTISGIIRSKSESLKILEIATIVTNNKNEEVVTGLAKVKYI